MRTAILAISLTIFLAGCSTYGMRQATDGNHYMVGDSNCVLDKSYAVDGELFCHDSNGNFTGTRSALSHQDVMVELQKEQMQQQSFQDGLNALKANKPVYCNKIGTTVMCY